MIAFREENSSKFFLYHPHNGKVFALPSALTAVRARVNARAEQDAEVQRASWPSAGLGGCRAWLSGYCATPPEVQGIKDSSGRSENI